ncbi:MAG: hypothetical protein U9N84_09940 [Actinomycetota bacterium]|nr:hypothetical protein [Actinomycetota bacterium]
MSKRIHRSLIVGLMVIGLVAAGGLAAVASAQHPADADLGEAPIEFEYFEDLGALVYWMPTDDVVDEGDEGDEPPLNCAELLTGFSEGAGTDPVDLEDFEQPGCVVIDVTGPNGQVNHGSVVSAFAHSVKDLDYDGPRGQLVSKIAQSRVGQDDHGTVDGDGDMDNDDEDSDDVKPEKVKKEKKEKREKKENPGRGNSKP